jgi:hypothetical protein
MLGMVAWFTWLNIFHSQTQMAVQPHAQLLVMHYDQQQQQQLGWASDGPCSLVEGHIFDQAACWGDLVVASM